MNSHHRSMKAKVGERGQVTIPKRLRKSLGIKPGEEVEFEERGGTLILRRRVAAAPLERLVGLIKERIDVDAFIAAARGPAWGPAIDRKSKKR